MGALNSKISPSSEILPTIEQGEGPFIDPRSPTLNINRSPIHQQEGIATRATITKGKNLATELTEMDPSFHLHTPINLLPKRFQSIIDPRSPSTFTRTPLVVDPASPAIDSNDSSLTTVVSSLAYEDSIIQEEDNMDASFKDCESQLPGICNLQIEYDDSAPIIEPKDEANEDTVFEDALVVPFAGYDPRSPSIAIARTPMVLVHDDAETDEANNEQQVESVLKLTAHTKEITESQQCTPPQGIQGSAVRGEQTPKKDNITPKAGNRTPLGCVTNTGGIRKIALLGQMKKTIGSDEQKLLSLTSNSSSAESNVSSKNINRSRIPKLRLS
ncbi:uncharacterized protein LOC131281177 [Anopheles ziemanni]|uniref:uncharacterized protein LOC131263491 n=1 Tax=Anopheles coustani TaxID=139045 RepID=UPI00265AFAB9|nr:uncharacterized protein LOC131263491 [Anopheles coustani]XP_058166419.1 uncharacterized protein LOC131281177 [Anopheles ziemanni]